MPSSSPETRWPAHILQGLVKINKQGKVWFIREQEDDALRCAASQVLLVDVTFVVDKQLQDEQQRTGVDNIHAWIEGYAVTGDVMFDPLFMQSGNRLVYYRPFAEGFTTYYLPKQQVITSPWAYLNDKGHIWIPARALEPLQ